MDSTPTPPTAASLQGLKPTMTDSEIDGFVQLVTRYIAEKNKQIEWGNIELPTADNVLPHGSLEECPSERARYALCL